MASQYHARGCGSRLTAKNTGQEGQDEQTEITYVERRVDVATRQVQAEELWDLERDGRGDRQSNGHDGVPVYAGR